MKSRNDLADERAYPANTLVCVRSRSGAAALYLRRRHARVLATQQSALSSNRYTAERFRTAAVGACSSGNDEQGFTTYRLAVMLFWNRPTFPDRRSHSLDFPLRHSQDQLTFATDATE
jgi:hypothetical protein